LLGISLNVAEFLSLHPPRPILLSPSLQFESLLASHASYSCHTTELLPNSND
jgi:hypothetical protein